MNFYLKKTSFAPVSVLFGAKLVRFAAKCGAFWCKMECVLVLNARRFGAKRKVKCC